MEGEASEALIAALLVALHIKGETVGEIVAAARALRAVAVTAPGVDPGTVDTCGTGGDGAQTFNISTAAAFAVAGAGVPVAKHGNRAASSRTGSIDVLEALGVRVDLPVEVSARILREVGIAPFFARRAHPAMRTVAPVRRELGFRTLMNCLGPLVNPMGVRFQLVGVYAGALVLPIARALGELGAVRALAVHGCDGLDEITTAGRTEAALRIRHPTSGGGGPARRGCGGERGDHPGRVGRRARGVPRHRADQRRRRAVGGGRRGRSPGGAGRRPR
jgi:anthranilate phosphoribosyltransferase